MHKHQNRPLQAAVPAGDSPPKRPRRGALLRGGSMNKDDLFTKACYELWLDMANTQAWVLCNINVCLAQASAAVAIAKDSTMSKEEKMAAFAKFQAEHPIQVVPPESTRL